MITARCLRWRIIRDIKLAFRRERKRKKGAERERESPRLSPRDVRMQQVPLPGLLQLLSRRALKEATQIGQIARRGGGAFSGHAAQGTMGEKFLRRARSFLRESVISRKARIYICKLAFLSLSLSSLRLLALHARLNVVDGFYAGYLFALETLAQLSLAEIKGETNNRKIRVIY